MVGAYLFQLGLELGLTTIEASLGVRRFALIIFGTFVRCQRRRKRWRPQRFYVGVCAVRGDAGYVAQNGALSSTC